MSNVFIHLKDMVVLSLLSITTLHLIILCVISQIDVSLELKQFVLIVFVAQISRPGRNYPKDYVSVPQPNMDGVDLLMY